MTVNAGTTNRTNINAENGNLLASIIADPNLLKIVLNEIYDYIDANWNDYNSFKSGTNYYTRTQLDSGQLDNRYYTQPQVDTKFQQVQAGQIVPNTIDNTKLVTDIKVGSLATITGLDNSSVTNAIIALLAKVTTNTNKASDNEILAWMGV